MAKGVEEALNTESRLGPSEVLVSGQIVVLKHKSTGALMFALLVACFAFQLNASMLSPALKGMETQLHATTAQIGLTQTAFFASAAVFSLFLPRLADLRGRRRVLSLMLLVTGIGCVVSALAPDVAWLFIGRIIQGVAGPVVVMCLILLRTHVTDPRRYALLLGIITSVNGGIAGVDAIAGGWLSEHFGFSSIFWSMAVVAVIAALALRLMANESTVADPPPMDWIGTGLLVAAVGSIYLIFNELAALAGINWGLVGILAVVAVAAFLAFWKSESKVAHPLVAIEYLRSRATWGLLLTTLLTLCGVFAVMNQIVPAIAQDTESGAGLSASAAPFVTLTPYALAGLAMGPVSGYLAGKFGYKRVLQVGLFCSVAGVLLTLALVNSESLPLLTGVSILVGIAYAGMANIMLNGLCVVLSPADNPGYLPGLNAGAFNLGAGLSFVILPLVQTALDAHGGVAAGYTGGILTGAAILLLAFAASFLIPKPRESRG
ncbi:uridine transporter UriT [Arthrobacter sp. YN]|uniref:uridine transporter UriT n=1 Tax=Arthrobacter sp. YN TaxID=2020486 RepID=UPI000B5F0463|nr:MFS transporter [Arthrobacter sp. YN]ASN20094.1 MFS transporter [Arthrobacter sp. YN]